MKLTIRYSTWYVIETYKKEEIPHIIKDVLVAGERSDVRRIAKSNVYLSRMHDGLRKLTGRNVKPEDVRVKKIELSNQTFGKGVGNLG